MRIRAHELGLTDAEIARRADLSPRRYGFYVTGDREPDFQTFIKICKVLATTPNELLGFENTKRTGKKLKQREALLARLEAATNVLDEEPLSLVVDHAELVLEHHN